MLAPNFFHFLNIAKMPAYTPPLFCKDDEDVLDGLDGNKRAIKGHGNVAEYQVYSRCGRNHENVGGNCF